MASGEPVVQILDVMPPATAYATLDTRNGTSSPAEVYTVWDFDASSTEALDFKCILRGYGGGGLTFTLPWSASSATSGTVQWEVAIRRIADDAEDVDTAHSYDYNSVSDTAASASGELSYPTVAFTNGADMDSWADGEVAIVRVQRNTAGSDTMTGDAELWALIGRET